MRDGVLEKLIAKANVERKAIDETGGNPERMTRHLIRTYALEYVDGDESQELVPKMQALGVGARGTRR